MVPGNSRAPVKRYDTIALLNIILHKKKYCKLKKYY